MTQRWYHANGLLRPHRIRNFGGSGSAAPPPYSNAYSLLFDGVDENVNVGNNLGIDGTAPWSFSAWIKPNSPLAGLGHDLFGKMSNNAGQNPGHAVQIFGSGGSTGTLRFILFDSAGGGIDAYSPSNIITTNWQHVVVTYDGSKASSGVKMYRNGSAVTVSASGSVVTSTANTNDGTIGSRNNTFYGGQYFNGYMDEVALFIGTELSAGDVTTIYGGGTPPDISGVAGLTNWYRMGDNDTYPTIIDVIGGKNGTMTNMESGDIVAVVP